MRGGGRFPGLREVAGRRGGEEVYDEDAQHRADEQSDRVRLLQTNGP